VISGRRQEFVDQIAVRGVDLDHIITGSQRTLGRATPGFDDRVDLRERKGAGSVIFL
jgi:hypothetical protein